MEIIDKKQCVPPSELTQEQLDEINASIEAEIKKLGIEIK